MDMDIKNKLSIMKARLRKLQQSPKNIKCPGVLRALSREIRNLERTL